MSTDQAVEVTCGVPTKIRTAVERGFPYPSFPTGWFQVGWSPEFEAGQVKPLHYFGRDLVAWRGSGGDVHVLDAFCPHLGAHLGYGGKVCDDDIVCPFHGWRWNAEGRNVEIPYSTRPNLAQRIGTWNVREVNDQVMVWYDADGREPTWEPPDVPEFRSGKYYPVYPDGVGSWINRTMVPQMLGENLADPAHQKYIHGANDVPEIVDYSGEGPMWHTRQVMVWGRKKDGTWLTPEGEAVGHLDIQGWGLGIALFRFDGIDETVQIQTITPIDESTCDLRMSNYVPKEHPEATELSEHARNRIAHLRRQVSNDLLVWENMEYITRPPLPPEEAKAYQAYRRWAQRFYPEFKADETDAASLSGTTVV